MNRELFHVKHFAPFGPEIVSRETFWAFLSLKLFHVKQFTQFTLHHRVFHVKQFIGWIVQYLMILIVLYRSAEP